MSGYVHGLPDLRADCQRRKHSTKLKFGAQTSMASCKMCGASKNKSEIDYTTICSCDHCSKDGDSFRALKNVEFAGFVFDESNDDYIDMIIASGRVSPVLTRRRPNRLMEREFEFDMSGIDTQASKELQSVVSPADELFYKGQLLPLDLPLRIQMVEKFDKSLSSETKPSCNCSGTRKQCRVPTPGKSCDVARKVGKETCNNGSATVLDRSRSTRSEQAAVAPKLKAPKAYLKSLLSKSSSTRGPNSHHSPNNIERDSYDDNDPATVVRRTVRENPSGTHQRSFSARFSFLKESPLISKHYAKPFSPSNRVSCTHSGAFARRSISSIKGSTSPFTSRFNHSKPFNSSSPRATPTHSGVPLKRSMCSADSDKENGIQGAIVHCKQSYSAEPKNMTQSSKYLQRTTSNPEGYAGGHSHGRTGFDCRIATCDQPAKTGLAKRVFIR